MPAGAGGFLQQVHQGCHWAEHKKPRRFARFTRHRQALPPHSPTRHGRSASSPGCTHTRQQPARSHRLTRTVPIRGQNPILGAAEESGHR